VNPADLHFSAYHNWPGFFALSTLITQAAGFDSALGFAAWAPVFFNLLNLGALLLVIKSLTLDQRLVWLSVWFYFLTNWVGQDYFSPQALSYAMHLILLGICLMWFKTTPKRSIATLPVLSRLKLGAPLLRRFSGPEEAVEMGNRPSQPLERVGLLTVILLLMTVIVFTHQLTPAMTIVSLTALVVSQRLSLRGLPLLMAVVTLTWMGYVAVDFSRETIDTIAATAARLISNTQSTFIDVSQVSAGQAVVSIIGRGLTVFIISLAFLGGIRRLAGGQRDLTAMLLLLSPVVALVISSYEGEMLFRVYLFSLPFLTFFAAAALFPHRNPGASIRSGRSGESGGMKTGAILVVLSCLLLGGFLFSHFGKDRQYHFTRNEFEASRFLYQTAPAGSLLIEGTPDYPTRFKNYEVFTYVPIAWEPLADRMNVVENPTDTLALWMSDDAYSASYLIITRSQKIDVDALGLMPPGSLDRIEQALIDDPGFTVIYSNPDASIFVLTEDRSGVP
jgi:hypothetical protein